MEIDQSRLRGDDDYRAEVYKRLVQEYLDGIWRFCVTRLGEVVGEDIAADVFLTAWENLPTFRQEAAPSTWLFGIAKNKCAQTLRDRARRRAILAQAMDEVRSGAHAMAPEMPEQQLAEQRQRRWLAESLARLRELDRLLVMVHYLKGLSIKEVAELTGLSEAAIRKRLLRALQRLREMDDGPSG
jgi:RNA polymerase sigma-70 factor (ECF subfamily)